MEELKAHGNLERLIFDKSIRADFIDWNITHGISPDDKTLKSGFYQATLNFYRVNSHLKQTRLQIHWKGILEFKLDKSLTEPYLMGLLESVSNEIREFSKRNIREFGEEIVIDLKSKTNLYQELYNVLVQGRKMFPPDEP